MKLGIPKKFIQIFRDGEIVKFSRAKSTYSNVWGDKMDKPSLDVFAKGSPSIELSVIAPYPSYAAAMMPSAAEREKLRVDLL